MAITSVSIVQCNVCGYTWHTPSTPSARLPGNATVNPPTACPYCLASGSNLSTGTITVP